MPHPGSIFFILRYFAQASLRCAAVERSEMRQCDRTSGTTLGGSGAGCGRRMRQGQSYRSMTRYSSSTVTGKVSAT